jgi:Arylsulfotransferase (ASST)
MKLGSSGLVALLAGLTMVAIAGPSVYPTGTTLYNPAKAFNTFVLITGGDGFARLIDMNGNSVHEWKNAGDLTTSLDPALTAGKRGHVLVTLSTVEGQGTDLVPGAVTTRITKTIGELDWDGRTVWTFGDKMPGGLARQHHDWARLPNGNTLVLSNLVHPVKGFKLPRLLDDVVYEVNPKGEVGWSWVASDHLDEFGFTAEQLELVRTADNGDYLHLNNMKPVGPNRWFAGGDPRFAPDNILIDSRNANFIAIIDRNTGKVVWRLGPNYLMANTPPTSRKVPRPLDRTSGQHDVQIIPEELPGAGNLLVFDNEGEAGYPPVPVTLTGGSRVLEIDPVKQQIVWQYTGEDSGGPGWSFRSTHISSARRLPNGNTLICEGQPGRVFQVTRDGEIVWEYVNAYPRQSKDPNTGRSVANYQLYRAQPVPYDFVPNATPHSEKPVTPSNNTQFRIR